MTRQRQNIVTVSDAISRKIDTQNNNTGTGHQRDREKYLKLSTNWNTTYLLVCWLHISCSDGLHLWLLGALFFLTLFVIYAHEKSWGVNWIPRDFMSYMQSFGLSSIYLVCNIDKTETRSLKLVTKWNTTHLLGCWLHISSGEGFTRDCWAR